MWVICVLFGSVALLTAPVVKTLFKSRHIVYSGRPSLSLLGYLKTKHLTRTASVKHSALLPKEAKVFIGSRGEHLNILPKFRYWVMAQEISGWAHVTYEKFWKCWVDLKYKREYIMALGQSSKATDFMTGASVRCALFKCESCVTILSKCTGHLEAIKVHQSEC